MSVIATIHWTAPPGSYGVKVEYKRAIDTIWITPTSPDNPTMDNEYPLVIDEGVLYNVRLSSIGPNCTSIFKYINVIYPYNQCCPVGYTLSPSGDYCYIYDDVPATPPSSSENAVAKSNIAYSTCGSYIYSPGWALDGTGSSSQISTSNPFWVNGAGICVDATTTDGPLNRTGIWAVTTLSNQDIGFAICVNLPSSKTYYIGIGADNYGIIRLDGTTILQQDPTALGIQYSVGASATFKVWHIYPVALTAGPHLLEILGHNVSGPAALGAEIYDATSAEIAAATSYAALGSKLIFSSKDFIGQPIQIGQNVGYTCPSGYSLAPCESPIICRRILTASTIPC